jgi:hypothetical protein
MDSVEDYARQWEKREKEDLDTLSEWVKSVRSLIHIRIKTLSGSMSTRSTSIFRGAFGRPSNIALFERTLV